MDPSCAEYVSRAASWDLPLSIAALQRCDTADNILEALLRESSAINYGLVQMEVLRHQQPQAYRSLVLAEQPGLFPLLCRNASYGLQLVTQQLVGTVVQGLDQLIRDAGALCMAVHLCICEWTEVAPNMVHRVKVQLAPHVTRADIIPAISTAGIVLSTYLSTGNQQQHSQLQLKQLVNHLAGPMLVLWYSLVGAWPDNNILVGSQLYPSVKPMADLAVAVLQIQQQLAAPAGLSTTASGPGFANRRSSSGTAARRNGGSRRSHSRSQRTPAAVSSIDCLIQDNLAADAAYGVAEYIASSLPPDLGVEGIGLPSPTQLSPADHAKARELVQSPGLLQLMLVRMGLVAKLMHEEAGGKSPIVMPTRRSLSGEVRRTRGQQQVEVQPHHRELLTALSLSADIGARRMVCHDTARAAYQAAQAIRCIIQNLPEGGLVLLLREIQHSPAAGDPMVLSRQLLLVLLEVQLLQPQPQLILEAMQLLQQTLDSLFDDDAVASDAVYQDLVQPVLHLLGPALLHAAAGADGQMQVGLKIMVGATLRGLLLSLSDSNMCVQKIREAFQELPLTSAGVYEASLRHDYTAAIRRGAMSESCDRTRLDQARFAVYLASLVDIRPATAATATAAAATAEANPSKIAQQLFLLLKTCLRVAAQKFSSDPASSLIVIQLAADVAAAAQRKAAQLQQFLMTGGNSDSSSTTSADVIAEQRMWVLLAANSLQLMESMSSLPDEGHSAAAAAAAAEPTGVVHRYIPHHTPGSVLQLCLQTINWVGSVMQAPSMGLVAAASTATSALAAGTAAAAAVAAGMMQAAVMRQRLVDHAAPQAAAAGEHADCDDLAVGSSNQDQGANQTDITPGMAWANLRKLLCSPGTAESMSFGAAVSAALPMRYCCNKPTCSNTAELSKLHLINRSGSRCSACQTAHYCSRECQMVHWRVHKPACQRLQRGVQSPEKCTA